MGTEVGVVGVSLGWLTGMGEGWCGGGGNKGAGVETSTFN